MNTYKTHSMAIAAALAHFDVELLNIEPDEEKTGKKIFVFKDDGQIKEIVKQYFDGNLKVDPNRYWDTIRKVKSRLYDHSA